LRSTSKENVTSTPSGTSSAGTPAPSGRDWPSSASRVSPDGGKVHTSVAGAVGSTALGSHFGASL
jgi:hypothetical protein